MVREIHVGLPTTSTILYEGVIEGSLLCIWNCTLTHRSPRTLCVSRCSTLWLFLGKATLGRTTIEGQAEGGCIRLFGRVSRFSSSLMPSNDAVVISPSIWCYQTAAFKTMERSIPDDAMVQCRCKHPWYIYSIIVLFLQGNIHWGFSHPPIQLFNNPSQPK